MTRNEHKSASTRKLTLFVAGLTCISLFAAGRQWLAGGTNRDKISAKFAMSSLILEGPELHASLRTLQIGSIEQLPKNIVLPSNPHLSSDDDFVEVIARGSSQGRLDREGIRSALYARYATDENEVGCYALEAKSDADADEREKAIREIWAYSESLDRAQVHRKDLVLIVLWNDGVSPECWQAINASVVERLNATNTL